MSSEERAKIKTTLKALASNITKLQGTVKKASLVKKAPVQSADKPKEVASLREKAVALRKEVGVVHVVEIIMLLISNLFGASLSKPHTSESALKCLSVCQQPHTVNVILRVLEIRISNSITRL